MAHCFLISLIPPKKLRSESMIGQKELFTKNKLCTLGHSSPRGSGSLSAQCGHETALPGSPVIATLTRGGILKSSLKLQVFQAF